MINLKFTTEIPITFALDELEKHIASLPKEQIDADLARRFHEIGKLIVQKVNS